MAIVYAEDVQAFLANDLNADFVDNENHEHGNDGEEDEENNPWWNDEHRDDEGDGGRNGGSFAYFLKQIFFPLLLFPLSRFGSKRTKAEEKKVPGEAKRVYLPGPKVYSCEQCRTHVSSDMNVISRAFQGRGGRAFLLDKVVNITTGPAEDRLLMTGLHTVADINCRTCNVNLGWKYEKAYEESQKYKEGKFILEKTSLLKEEALGGWW